MIRGAIKGDIRKSGLSSRATNSPVVVVAKQEGCVQIELDKMSSKWMRVFVNSVICYGFPAVLAGTEVVVKIKAFFKGHLDGQSFVKVKLQSRDIELVTEQTKQQNKKE